MQPHGGVGWPKLLAPKFSSLKGLALVQPWVPGKPCGPLPRSDLSMPCLQQISGQHRLSSRGRSIFPWNPRETQGVNLGALSTKCKLNP